MKNAKLFFISTLGLAIMIALVIVAAILAVMLRL